MKQYAGVYTMKNSKGQLYYKASITYRGKHISLGSYSSAEAANRAYLFANDVLHNKEDYHIDSYTQDYPINILKWTSLINFRDHGLYFKTPIYLMQRYFLYYLDETTLLKFDVDDLFYYAKHKITQRGGHLFVADYGMQINIMSRYGIKNYAVPGKDFQFINGDPTDYRYANIEIINRFHGVRKEDTKQKTHYVAKIHINGDYIIGRYSTDIEAAVAYNKAAALVKSKGCQKNFPENYIDELDEITYSAMYQKLHISRNIRNLVF